MQTREIMTANPACCTPDSKLENVAWLMVRNNCGAIPVVDSQESKRPLGIITDRDICCRTVAQGKNPLELTAIDCMTDTVYTVDSRSDLDDCCKAMEQFQVRRMIVTDDAGRCCGIVSQADIAKSAPQDETAEVVREISLAA